LLELIIVDELIIVVQSPRIAIRLGVLTPCLLQEALKTINFQKYQFAGRNIVTMANAHALHYSMVEGSVG